VCPHALNIRKKGISCQGKWTERCFLSGLTADQNTALCRYRWLGNIRELKKILDWAIQDSPIIDCNSLGSKLGCGSKMDRFERPSPG
jgi:DNA-binding NtrC family response regulator